MLELILQDMLYVCGVGMFIGSTGLGIVGWRKLRVSSGALRKMQQVEQDLSWYTYPPILINLGTLLSAPAFFLLAITMFFPEIATAWLIIRLVLSLVAFFLIGTSLFFTFKGNRLSREKLSSDQSLH